MANSYQRIAGLSEKVVSSDEQLKSYIRANVGTYCHASGTAPIGPDGDPTAVLDQKCRVRGTDNLYVVDASVFPIIPSAVPNLTVMMLGERLAEWLKGHNSLTTGEACPLYAEPSALARKSRGGCRRPNRPNVRFGSRIAVKHDAKFASLYDLGLFDRRAIAQRRVIVSDRPVRELERNSICHHNRICVFYAAPGRESERRVQKI